MSVCSLRLMRTSAWPDARAKAAIRLVFPTPGEPSSKIGFVSCIARSARAALRRAEGAEKEKASAETPSFPRGPRGIVNGAMPKNPSRSISAPSPDPPGSAAGWAPGFAAASIAGRACARRSGKGREGGGERA